jgi:23S rRNA pseudouridine1911/1915/1917 synthase
MMSDQYFFHPDWPVLYEDNHLLGLYKPAGLLVQGDQTGEPSLLGLGKAWLKERYHKPGEAFLGLVHRLDRPVAGVLLFCRTSKAARRVSEQFRLGEGRKYYLAILEGKLK